MASNVDSTRDCASRLRVLSDQTRLAVLRRLMNGPRAVSELNAELQIEPSLLSHHLQILREEGWVKNRRVGRSVIYELASSIRRTSKDPTLDLGCCRLSFK